jgi:4-alpha-glucanotransferase
LNRVSLALLIHAHQPVGNFDHVMEEAYQKCYAPFLRALRVHPRVHMSLHFSGILLEWIEGRHPEYFAQLRQLIAHKQIELVGGGYYEPILPAIPDDDKIAQIRKLAAYIEDQFDMAPRGAWVAERVWEPSLAKPLAAAKVDYVVLDDTHFLAAGLEPWQLNGTFITEEVGSPLRLVPSLKPLRYTIPFQEPQETLKILRQGASEPGTLFAMGDDYEKFGVWPGTHEHCYTNGWLGRFLKAIEDANEWVETTTLSAYLAAHAPVGRVYLPTASYAEMMEWAMPTPAAQAFKETEERVEKLPSGAAIARFLRGGLWRNFLSKYSESNQMQKMALRISRRCQQARLAAAPGTKTLEGIDAAHAHLLAGQCNDPYWHGVFGGLYAPHLRSGVLQNLIKAEALLDSVDGVRQTEAIQVEKKDWDVDGHDEILLEHPAFGMVVNPARGGTVSSLRHKSTAVELVNSLMRRPEPYHALVKQRASDKAAPREGPASIHDLMLSKEANLDKLLRYDNYERHGFRTYVFDAGRQWSDFELLRLGEHRELAGGAWEVVTTAPAGKVEMRRPARMVTPEAEVNLEARKILSTRVADGHWFLECQSVLGADRACATGLAIGVEMVFNLLAPDAPDRYFFANEVRRPLEFRGEIRSSQLLMADEWQKVQIVLSGHPDPRWWIVPIETISQSESGYEKVYQGSAIMAVWKIEPPSWRNVTRTLQIDVSEFGA